MYVENQESVVDIFYILYKRKSGTGNSLAVNIYQAPYQAFVTLTSMPSRNARLYGQIWRYPKHTVPSVPPEILVIDVKED